MSERDGDDDIDDASLRSMRAVWLSMRDEEPPAAGMSALLAAARDRAEQMHSPSLWQRVLAQLRRPPALAFATVMLLIGGAVLVTRNAEQKVPSMTADVEKPAPVVAPADPVESRFDHTSEPPAAETEVPAPTAPPAVKDVAPKPKKRSKPARVAEEIGANEPDRYRRFDDDEPEPSFGGGKATEPTVMESPGRAAPSPAAPKRPAAQEVPPADSVTLSEDATVSTPPNEQLARQAESAASRGDCAAVRGIVARMKKQDASFYKTRLGKNAAVTKCL